MSSWGGHYCATVIPGDPVVTLLSLMLLLMIRAPITTGNTPHHCIALPPHAAEQEVNYFGLRICNQFPINILQIWFMECREMSLWTRIFVNLFMRYLIENDLLKISCWRFLYLLSINQWHNILMRERKEINRK